MRERELLQLPPITINLNVSALFNPIFFFFSQFLYFSIHVIVVKECLYRHLLIGCHILIFQ